MAYKIALLSCVLLLAACTTTQKQPPPPPAKAPSEPPRVQIKKVKRFDGLAMLARLSGREHRVLTAVCLRWGSEMAETMSDTRVRFASLSREQCEAYLATDEPWDKAGGYGIQGMAGAFVVSLAGSYSGVVGLPLAETWALLQGAGIVTALDGPVQ